MTFPRAACCNFLFEINNNVVVQYTRKYFKKYKKNINKYSGISNKLTFPNDSIIYLSALRLQNEYNL